MACSLTETLLLAQVAATMAMVGVIWFAQLVHYPLLSRVDSPSFPDYELSNMHKTGWVVGPLMLTEAFTALTMLCYLPEGIRPFQAWLGLCLLIVIWVSTAWLQVPLHKRLLTGFDPKVHRRLVRTNWIRTWAWSARGGLVLWMLHAVLR
jgi:hypothetical protein